MAWKPTQRNSTYLQEPKSAKLYSSVNALFFPTSEVEDLWFEEVLNDHESYSFILPSWEQRFWAVICY